MILHTELEQFLKLRKKFQSLLFFFSCFNPDVRLARQRRLFSDNLSAIFTFLLYSTQVYFAAILAICRPGLNIIRAENFGLIINSLLLPL